MSGIFIRTHAVNNSRHFWKATSSAVPANVTASRRLVDQRDEVAEVSDCPAVRKYLLQSLAIILGRRENAASGLFLRNSVRCKASSLPQWVNGGVGKLVEAQRARRP